MSWKRLGPVSVAAVVGAALLLVCTSAAAPERQLAVSLALMPPSVQAGRAGPASAVVQLGVTDLPASA